jgi:hypothetical protein
MGRRISMISGCFLTVSLGAVATALAQFNPPPTPPTAADPDNNWRKDVTVLAIAPDGTWGVATETFVGRAIARAIEACKSKYQREIGCGYRFTSVRSGWSLGFRCGTENIIVADRSLAAAEQTAFRQEHELKTRYVPNMPACERVVTVNPQGVVVGPRSERAT